MCLLVCCWTTSHHKGRKRVVICRWDEQKDEAMCAAEMDVSYQQFVSSSGWDGLEGDIVAKSFICPHFVAGSVKE